LLVKKWTLSVRYSDIDEVRTSRMENITRDGYRKIESFWIRILNADTLKGNMETFKQKRSYYDVP
jgi:hypothetical protein